MGRRQPCCDLISHRFPPPWSVEKTDACFIIWDANEQARSPYVYFEDEPGGVRRRTCSPVMRRGGNIAKLPESLAR